MADVERGTNENRELADLLPKTLIVILSSVHCLIMLCIILVIPILEVAIGASYRGQCPINPNIPIYLIVTGACGMTTIFLVLVIIAGFIWCVQRNSIAATCTVMCLIFLIASFMILMSLFLFAWFIVGNVWIFGAKNNVQYDSSMDNYCHRTLYEFAFAILIISYVLPVVGCIVQCIRGCCQIKNN